ERVGPLLALRVRVAEHAAKLRLAHRLDEVSRLLLEGRPTRADGIEIGKIVGTEHGARGDALPALEPDPLGVHDVHEGIPQGTMARASGSRELRSIEAGRRIEDALVCPRAVLIQRPDVFDAHLRSPPHPTLSPFGGEGTP